MTTALEAAEQAYAEIDVTAFREAMDRVQLDLPCVTDPIPRHLAAQTHRMTGLRAFIDRDPTASTKAFAAARSVLPGDRFPETLVPPGNPVLLDYETIDVATGQLAEVYRPSDGYLQFDGRAGTERPTSWPTVLQVFDGDGAVRSTTYLWPEMQLPEGASEGLGAVRPGEGELVAAPPPVEPPVAPEPPALPTERPPRAHRGRAVLTLSAVGAAITSGVLHGVAAKTHQTYEDAPQPELDGLPAKTNGAVIASAAPGSVAVGLGVTAVYVAKW